MMCDQRVLLTPEVLTGIGVCYKALNLLAWQSTPGA